MGDLAPWLSENIVASDDEEKTSWSSVQNSLREGNHLEAALERNSLPDRLVAKVVRSTWNFIAKDDYSLLKTTIENENVFPLQKLFSGLFRSTNRNINVITTNYDRVVEYAADTGGYLTHTGFLPGYLRRADGAEGLSFRQGSASARTVTIWKVHGSLDWFSDAFGNVLSLPLTNDLPKGLTPLIVTPGVSKYQRTHDEPFRSAIQGADSAISAATAFLCVGYGFRDSHIHPKLITQCRVHDTPILVAAKSLTSEAKDFLRNNAGRFYLALEDHECGTMVYSRDYPDGAVVKDGKYWELPALNELFGC